MRCETCGKEIDNMWGFCPYCGSFAGDIEESFTNIARMFGGKAVVRQEGDSFIVVLEMHGVRQAFRITPLDIEEAFPLDIESQKEVPPPEPERVFERTEEPPTQTNHRDGNIYIKVDLEDVAEEDITINSLEDSIEIRAYKGETRYFKLIPIPPGYHIVSTEFLPGEVFIVLKKE
jgi:hypothetical protein